MHDLYSMGKMHQESNIDRHSPCRILCCTVLHAQGRWCVHSPHHEHHTLCSHFLKHGEIHLDSVGWYQSCQGLPPSSTPWSHILCWPCRNTRGLHSPWLCSVSSTFLMHSREGMDLQELVGFWNDPLGGRTFCEIRLCSCWKCISSCCFRSLKSACSTLRLASWASSSVPGASLRVPFLISA